MKRIKLYEIISFLVLISLTVAAGISCSKTAAGKDLAGVTWVLQSYGVPPNMSQVVADKQTTLKFDADKMTVSGSGGVNGFGGDYEVDSNKITFSGVIHTLIATEGPIMGQETAFFKILNSAETFKIEEKRLTITGTEGTLIFNHQ